MCNPGQRITILTIDFSSASYTGYERFLKMDLVRRLKTNEENRSRSLTRMDRDDHEAIDDHLSKPRKAHGNF